MPLPVYIPHTKLIPTDPNGGVPVNIQDQTTPPFLAYLTQEVSTFTLSSDTGESGILVENYIYNINVNAGHSISENDYIILY